MFGQATLHAMNNPRAYDKQHCDFCEQPSDGFYLVHGDDTWLKECQDCRDSVTELLPK